MGPRVAFLAADGVEHVEHATPWKALRDAGAEPVLVSIGGAPVRSFRWPDPGPTLDADLDVAWARAQDFELLVLPGGTAGPDLLRGDDDAVTLVRAFATSGRTVAAICHAPWLLIDAGLADGRTLTSWPTIRVDLVNAGATWVDQPVVVDRGVVTSRCPDDLDEFCRALVTSLPARSAHRPVGAWSDTF